ncbi:MAG: sulfotransferase domain-containing protein, partial [Anaerolineae bacterium]|nr:sulfotransferase domain-containing protein [Anaerolineae bacterium]
YEDLLGDTYRQMSHLCDFLELKVSDAALKNVIRKYTPDQIDTSINDSLLHFNKGRIGNYKDVLDAAHLRQVENHFRQILPKMGYEV